MSRSRSCLTAGDTTSHHRRGAGRRSGRSDYPFEIGDPDPIAHRRGRARLSEGDRAKILHGNVERLLGDIAVTR